MCCVIDCVFAVQLTKLHPKTKIILFLDYVSCESAKSKYIGLHKNTTWCEKVSAYAYVTLHFPVASQSVNLNNAEITIILP